MVLVGACDSAPASSAPPYQVESCDVTLWYEPQSSLSRVEVVTSWESWQTGLLVLTDEGNGWSATKITPPPGEQEYAFIDDGVWVTDPYVGTTAFHDGIEVSLIFMQDCTVPSLQIASNTSLAFVAANDAAPLAPASVQITSDVQGTPTTDDKGNISIAWAPIPQGKHIATVTASDVKGRATAPARITLWSDGASLGLARRAHLTRSSSIVIATRRAALPPPSFPAAWAGGTLGGLTADLDNIASRGFNALWVSPLYENPQGTWPGTDGQQYSAYHGYWPIAPRAIDARFGTEQDVDDFIAAAHARNMRVLFDVVPHHVHQQHPYVAAHPGAPWFTDWNLDCVCGVGSCDWNDHMEDCWFAQYLPSLDFHDLDVDDTVTSDVVWWLDHFDADGLRIDAVPMMPRAANRRIAAATRKEFDYPGQRTYLLGENFVGPGAYDLLRYELGPFGIDGEFDFPMMWALRDAIAQETGLMAEIDAAEQAGEASWAGSGAIMSRMIGNHDVARFSSVSNGDAIGDGYADPPAVQATDPLVYAKQQMALAVAYTLPGAAVVFYGDEVGLAGKNDPDCRRVMPADATLSQLQVATRNFATSLGKARACSDALRRGTRIAPSSPTTSHSPSRERTRRPETPPSSSSSETPSLRSRSQCREWRRERGSTRSAAASCSTHRRPSSRSRRIPPPGVRPAIQRLHHLRIRRATGRTRRVTS